MSVGGDVRVGCVFEEFCDEACRAFEGDRLAGWCLGRRHDGWWKEGASNGARVGRDGGHVTQR